MRTPTYKNRYIFIAPFHIFVNMNNIFTFDEYISLKKLKQKW